MRVAPRGRGPSARFWTDAFYRARRPVEILLTASLRGVARRQPEAFDRLGPIRHATIRIDPVDLPVAFELLPDGEIGSIRIVRPDDDMSKTSARITGPILTLLTLFDGRGDADGAFFQRSIDVEGDTVSILALHNALEASELTMADILSLPRRFDPPLQTVLSVARRWRAAGVRA